MTSNALCPTSVRKAALVASAAILLLCTCDNFPTLPPLAETVAPAASLPQSATVGEVLTASVSVTDGSGNALTAFPVTFLVTSGGGSVNVASAFTDGTGVVAVLWTLGTTPGPQQLVATASGKTTSFNVTAIAGAASQIAASPGVNGQTAPPGGDVPIPPSVIVRDSRGNPKSGVAVTFAVASGGGSITGAAATTNASGVAAVGSWTLGPIAQTNTLTATSPGLTGSPVTFTATAVAVGGTLSVNAGNNQSAPVNTAVAIAPSVVIRDVNQNPVVGATVTFAVASGGGSVTGATTQTNGSGIATVGSWTLGNVAGINTMTATSAAGSATFTATGIAAGATSLTIRAGQSQTSVSGSPVPISPSVLVSDQFGNPASGVVVTFAVASGGGSVTGSPAITNSSGIATVGSWILGPTAGANSITASASGLATVTFTATGVTGVGTMSMNAGNNQTVTVNTPVAVPPSVIIKDNNGNPIVGVSVTFAVTAGGGSVSGATTTTNASGIATIGGWTLGTTAGTNSLSATSSAGVVLFSATGIAGPASQMTLNSGNNQTAAAGTQVLFSPSVIVRDAFNNPKGGVLVTFAVASGGGSTIGGVVNTSPDGVARIGGWILGRTAGVNTLTATSAGLTGSPMTFTATGIVGPAASIAANGGNGQSAPAGSAVTTPPSVVVKDAYGNPVVGVSVTFAVGSGGGSATGVAATTDPSGIAAVGSWTLGSIAGPNTLTATSGSLSGSPVTFTATGLAVPTSIAANGGNAQTANAGTAVATPPSAIVKDANGNPVGGVPVTFAVASGGGSATGVTATTNASGVATVGSWTLGTAAGQNSLTATSGTLSGSPVTFTATGVAGPAASIALNGGNGQTATVGTAVATPPSVIVTDAFGNPVNGTVVTFSAGTGGGRPATPVVTTNASGIATVSWTLGTVAGANTLTASVSGVSSSLTFTATATPDGPQTMVYNAGSNQTASPGSAVPTPPSVKIMDQYGNPVAGVQVIFAVGSGGGSVTGGSAATDANGIAAVGSWILGPGANTLNATAAAVAGVVIPFTATGQ